MRKKFINLIADTTAILTLDNALTRDRIAAYSKGASVNTRDCTVHETLLIEKIEEIINSNETSDLALCIAVALREMNGITIRKERLKQQKMANSDTDWWVDSANRAIDVACETVFDN